jgi:UPF0755 protein
MEQQRRQRRRWVIGALLALGGLAVVGGAGGAWAWWRWSGRPVGAGKPARVTVAKGATPTSLGHELEARGVIRSARGFALRGRETTIRPGVYDLSPAQTPEHLLRQLSRGDIAREKATFPEGFTVAQIGQRLAERGLVDGRDFLDLASRRGGTLRASFRPPANLEGFLFPDTYTFPVGADAEAVAQQMLGNFDRLVARGRAAEIRRSRRSLREIVTVASLIEREAVVRRDRPLIAGVIYNRLARGMPLQIDATVQYARVLRGDGHKPRLLFRDLEIDSPYNTYRIRGLPPGPICNPGLDSIAAALAPTPSPYLYYVARGDGSHVFGRTLDEHNRNIALVRRGAGGGPRS